MLTKTHVRRLYVWHKWLGLLTGLVILYLTLTGTALVFKEEIDRALNADLLVSTPGPRSISADEALATVQATYPDLLIDDLAPPSGPTSVYVVQVAGHAAFDQVMVDPYTGQIRGTRPYDDSFAHIARQLHIKFYGLQWPGRVLVGLFGLALLASTVLGLLIYGRFMRGLVWWKPRGGPRLQVQASDWHKLIGVLTLAFNLVIAVTGAVLGLEELGNVEPAIEQAVQPTPPPAILALAPPPGAPLLSLDDAVARVRTVMPDFVPTKMEPAAHTVRHHYLQGNLRGDIAMEGASHAVVDAVTGQLLHVHNAREAALVTRAYNWMDPLHFGTFGGIAMRIAYVLFGLMAAVLPITGFALYIAKRYRRRPASPLSDRHLPPTGAASQPRAPQPLVHHTVAHPQDQRDAT
ncbi:MAG: PepSY-associated TM helix domain-containing protein [Bacteroidota bacterium]